MTSSEIKQIKQFGRNIAAIRKDQKMTQEQLADATGMAVRSIQNLELGERWPRLETLLMVSRALKAAPQDFFKGIK